MNPRAKLLLLLWITLSTLLSLVSSACAMGIAVTTAADVINGNVSSISALISSPGPDGISLREAIVAANNTDGSHTITFSPELNHQTIMLTNTLPPITRSQVTIKGFSDANGEPAVTIDAGQSSRGGFLTMASDFTVTHL